MKLHDTNEKRLIVNADDLGMSRGITDGILMAHRHGIVTSASLMVNMPASAYALERLRTAPRLGVGVHLNICQGQPILPAGEVRSLVDENGSFLPAETMIRKLWRWQAKEHEIEAEFHAQIHWMRDRSVEPTHADSHRHLHIFPAAVRPFARALAAEGIRCARAPRCRQWPANGIGGPHGGNVARRLLVQAYRSIVQSIVFRRRTMADSRVAFASRDRANPSELLTQWARAFDSFGVGTFEFACHPGIAEAGFSENDAIAEQREQELRVLMDARTRKAIERNQIQLIRYDDLLTIPAPLKQAAGAPAT